MSGAMHNELGRVGVEVLGVTGPEGRIMLVTDIATGRSDGAVTPGDDIRIDGYKVKIVGLPQPDGGTEPGIGVFFVDPDGSQWQAARVSENKPSHLLVRVPDDLPRLTCRLRIVTRYTRGVIPIKTPRIIEYYMPLTPVVT
jgi:hypothetical protein